MNPPPTTELTDPELHERHTALYKKFLPTLRSYTEMASEALELQQEMYSRRLAAEFPHARRTNAAALLTLSARETPARFDKVMQEVQNQKIVVTEVIYDDRRQEFRLYGQVPA